MCNTSINTTNKPTPKLFTGWMQSTEGTHRLTIDEVNL